MLILKVVSLFLLVVASANSFPSGNVTTSATRLSQNEDLQSEYFPFVVLLVDHTSYRICSGSCIHQSWILTAGHCIDSTRFRLDLPPNAGDQDRLAAVMGNSKVEESKQTRRSKRLLIHPLYVKYPMANDIGLVKIKEPFVINSYIDVIGISKIRIEYDKLNVILLGWEYARSKDDHVENEIPLSSLNILELQAYECNEAVNNHQMLCAGEPGRVLCKGASGGPMVYQGVVIGVLSHLVGKTCNDTPVYYESVYKYHKWIQEKLLADVYFKSSSSNTGISLLYLATISFLFFRNKIA